MDKLDVLNKLFGIDRDYSHTLLDGGLVHPMIAARWLPISRKKSPAKPEF